MWLAPRRPMVRAAVCILLGAPLLSAQADTTHDEKRDAAARADANPLPYVTLLKFTPSYTWSHDNLDYKAQLEFQAIVPYEGMLIPELVVDDTWSIARVQVFAESMQNE